MELKLFISDGCYPCERAKAVFSKELPDLEVEYIKRPDKRFAEYCVTYTPVLVIEHNGKQERLDGAHNIKKIEVLGLIDDFLNC